jgi:hypothetical protein
MAQEIIITQQQEIAAMRPAEICALPSNGTIKGAVT